MRANTVLFVLHIDENVEVIYVSPVRLGEDVLQYYTRLLGLQTAIELGDASAPESHCAKRFTILMPEALEYFSVWCTTYTHTLIPFVSPQSDFLNIVVHMNLLTIFIE